MWLVVENVNVSKQHQLAFSTMQCWKLWQRVSNIIDIKLTFMIITPVYDTKCIFILDFKDFPNGRHWILVIFVKINLWCENIHQMLLKIPVFSFLTDKITLNHQNMTFYHFGIYAFFKMAAIPAILDFRVVHFWKCL